MRVLVMVINEEFDKYSTITPIPAPPLASEMDQPSQWTPEWKEFCQTPEWTLSAKTLDLDRFLASLMPLTVGDFQNALQESSLPAAVPPIPVTAEPLSRSGGGGDGGSGRPKRPYEELDAEEQEAAESYYDAHTLDNDPLPTPPPTEMSMLDGLAAEKVMINDAEVNDAPALHDLDTFPGGLLTQMVRLYEALDNHCEKGSNHPQLQPNALQGSDKDDLIELHRILTVILYKGDAAVKAAPLELSPPSPRMRGGKRRLVQQLREVVELLYDSCLMK